MIGPVRLAFVVTAPEVKLAPVPVSPVPAPVKLVDERTPVEGLNVSLVEVTFCGRFPVFEVTHVMSIVALVDVSSVMAVFVAFVAVVELVAEVAVAALPPMLRAVAVPVKFVAVIDDGVPPGPLKVTKAPADPTLTASAVATFVPKPVMPPTATAEAVPAVKLAAVPVAFVRTMEAGVPPAPLKRTTAPAPPMLTAKAVATPVPNPLIPVETATCAQDGLLLVPVLER